MIKRKPEEPVSDEERTGIPPFSMEPITSRKNSRVQALRRLGTEWVLKLAFFNLALTLFWFVLRGLFLHNPPAWLGENSLLLYAAGNAVFVVYDLGLSRLIALFQARLRPGGRLCARQSA